MLKLPTSLGTRTHTRSRETILFTPHITSSLASISGEGPPQRGSCKRLGRAAFPHSHNTDLHAPEVYLVAILPPASLVLLRLPGRAPHRAFRPRQAARHNPLLQHGGPVAQVCGGGFFLGGGDDQDRGRGDDGEGADRCKASVCMDEGGGSDGIRDGIVIDRCLMCLPTVIYIRRSPLSLVISDIPNTTL